MKQPYFASSESVEHYTPRYIWERAIRCMGAIDCDPAVANYALEREWGKA